MLPFVSVPIRSRTQHPAHNVCPLYVLSLDSSLLFTLAETAHMVRRICQVRAALLRLKNLSLC